MPQPASTSVFFLNHMKHSLCYFIKGRETITYTYTIQVNQSKTNFSWAITLF